MPTGMFERRPCAKGCGKLLDPRGAHRHEATCAGNGTADTTADLPPRQERLANGRPHKKAPRSGAQDGGCEHCLFRGLTQAIDQELVAEAVRGGMNLAGAAAFVRRVRATA